MEMLNMRLNKYLVVYKPKRFITAPRLTRRAEMKTKIGIEKMNELSKKLEEFLDDHLKYKGKFIGYKKSRGGLGVSRIDDDWFECDDYLIRFEDLIEILSNRASEVGVKPEVSLPGNTCSECFHEWEKIIKEI